MADREELEFDELIERIGRRTEQLEAIPDDEVRGLVFELLDYLEAYHREGLARFASAVPADVLHAARADPLVASLLDVYLGDDEADPTPLVEEALEEIRPYVHSHGGEMDIVGVADGVVTLRLMGSCHGCPSSVVTLTQGVERALRERWTGFRELKVEGEQQPGSGPKLLQIQSLRRE